MRRNPRARRTALALAVLTPVVAAILAQPSISGADVTAVIGSATGASANVSIFNSPPMIFGPVPTVTLPAGGSAVPVTASAPSVSFVAGPATLLNAGATTVSTQGTTGPAGSVTSSTNIGPTAQALTNPCPANSAGGGPTATSGGTCVYAGPFTADAVASTCTASFTVTGSTTITNGQLVTATDANQNPTAITDIPVNPPPNLTISGTLQLSATDTESFTYIFNEQIMNADASLTVNAAH